MSEFETYFDVAKAQKNVFGALLEARKKSGGKTIALEDADGRKLSYDDLVRASFALGSALTKNTDTEEAIGVMLPTSAGALISFFAVNAFGRVPAMLNFTAGLSNIQSACKAAGIKKIVTATQFIEKANLGDLRDSLNKDVEFLYLEDVRENLSLTDKIYGGAGPILPSLFRFKAHWDSTAVILFTSGTEGAPKGVALSHLNLVSNVQQILQHVSGMLTKNDVIYNPLPTFHCFGLTAGALIGLLSGIKVVLHPSPLQIKEIPKRISETNATILFATDTFLSQYARASHNDELSKLRYVVCGAESVKDETRQLVKKKFNIEILEGYGATEAAPVLAVNQPNLNRSGTVGRPLPGVKLHFEEVEGISGAGRMKASGPNVMKGYIFVDDPKVIQPVEDMWHDTGDVVSQDEDGSLTIRGRLKRFAKIGGEMVSLAVVENCAKSIWPDFEHAAAVLPDDRKGEQIILLTTTPQAERMDMLHWLQNHGVSELSMPRKLYYVEEIPLLGSGKMDIGKVQAIAEQKVSEKEN
ncbi:AMP-binding protein [Hirschia litorea]|uniref:AMP-binding protein n=1 Tax=Hirschia litorea TaxID=1199156 RepID=A0ABW2IHD7_9PROT